jgi:hypothetical protein
MPSDDLEAAIEKAQADLAEACRALPLKTDPIRLVLAADSSILSVFGRSIRRFERAVADVIAARDPLTDNDRAALVEATENGAYRAMRIEAQRVVRTLDRKTMALIGLGCGGAYLLGVLSVLALLAFGVLREKAEAIPGLSCGYSQQGQWFCVAPLPKQH